ncbi:MAG TPA: SDR family NAD(P)-dependent oxidoreductase, partial [Tepidiformaceae bacterium]|nr:SDR family NAD(P)-dependent oxidoreductase [Tepidiformaceae bacterium]
MTSAAPSPNASIGRILEGKVAIITGASRGIGAAAVHAFTAAGASVVLAARDGNALEALVAKVSADGGSALAVPTDVGDPNAVQLLLSRSLEHFGRVD